MGDDWNAHSMDSFNANANWSPIGDDFHNNSTNGYQSDNIGHVANVFDTGVAGDGETCRNCGRVGHFARECQAEKRLGACFNCGEEGHSKAECTKPRVFRGTCNVCQVEGHAARDCPQKPKVCQRCKMENDHETTECKNNYFIDLSDVPDLTEAQAWNEIAKASNERDIGDFKDALRILSKTAPEVTYTKVEKELRTRKMNIFIVALKKEIGPAFTNVNLQGESDQTYCVGFFTSGTCQRPILLPMWPKDAEENLERLADAGVTMESNVPLCKSCHKPGHNKKDCPEASEFETPKIICALCGEEGHRVRDCTEPRQKPRGPKTCKFCESEEHLAAECPEKPKMECRNCGGEHKAAECTEPRVMRCFNCNSTEHQSRECPQPKDWSKVKCKHCGEFGHASASRCQNPPAEKGVDGGDRTTSQDVGTFNNDSGGNEDWQVGGSTGSAQAAWETAVDTPAMATAGKW